MTANISMYMYTYVCTYVYACNIVTYGTYVHMYIFVHYHLHAVKFTHPRTYMLYVHESVKRTKLIRICGQVCEMNTLACKLLVGNINF